VLQKTRQSASKVRLRVRQMRQRHQPKHSNKNKHHHRVRRVGISLDGDLEGNRNILWRKNGIFLPRCKRRDAHDACASQVRQMRQRQQPANSGKNKHHHRVRRVKISLDGAFGGSLGHLPEQKRQFPAPKKMRQSASPLRHKCASRPKSPPSKQTRHSF